MTFEVQVFDSTEKAAIPKCPSQEDVASIIVCGETRPFRFLGRHLQFREPTERLNAIDLGCSTGETTCVLAKRFKKVIGFDVSQEVVTKGMQDHPGVDLRVLDVLSERSNLLVIIKRELDGTPIFFVDIGGDRMQDTVILFLSYLLEVFINPTIVVKSRKLYHHLLKVCLDEDKIHCNVQAWERLVVDTREKELKDRKCFHPQRYLLRLTPNGDKSMPICRYHNYSECKKGDSCGQDHTYCHHCLELGHRGSDCPVLAVEIIVRKRKT